jgi:hypothetical protein
MRYTKHTEIKLTHIQGFGRICLQLLLGRGLEMEVYLSPVESKGCQVPHFSIHYNVMPDVCLGVSSDFMERRIHLIFHSKS